MFGIAQVASVFSVWKIHVFVALEKCHLLTYNDLLQQILSVDKPISRTEFLAYIALAEIPAAKRTPFTFSIYSRALLGTHRASPLVFTRRLSKNHHTLLSRPA